MKRVKEVGPYLIEQPIGQGSYGQVYRAKHKTSGEYYAVKMIAKKGKHAKQLACLRGQIEIMRKLKHENIIQLVQSYENTTQIVIITELADRDLSSQLDLKGGYSQEEIKVLAKQIINALLYLNDNRIVHRDLKPQNILISNGVIKLCDFGFARKMSMQTVVLRSLKGTPLYIAPEIFKQQPYTYKIDIWSLGIILYELATGLPPYYSDNYYSLFNKIINEKIHFPESMSPQLCHLIEVMVQKDPDHRADWATILSSSFFQRQSSTPAPLSFSIQLEQTNKIRMSLLPPAPPTLTLSELKEFDKQSVDDPQKLRSSLMFYHKMITLFTMVVHKSDVSHQWVAAALNLIARIVKKQPSKPLDYDIAMKRDLFQTIVNLIPQVSQDLQTSSIGVLGLLAKARGSSLQDQQVQGLMQELNWILPDSKKSFANIAKLCGIISQGTHGLLVLQSGVLDKMLDRIGVQSPNEHFISIEVALSLIKNKVNVWSSISKRFDTLNLIIQQRDELIGFGILSLYAHYLSHNQAVEPLRASKPPLPRSKFNIACSHLQFFILCKLGIPPPFQGNCPLTGLLALQELCKNKVFSGEEARRLAVKVNQLLRSSQRKGHKDIDCFSQFNDYAVRILVALQTDVMKEVPILEVLISQANQLSEQGLERVLPLIEKLPGEMIKAGTVNQLCKFIKKFPRIPCILSKHFIADSKSKAALSYLHQIEFGKFCLTTDYLSKANAHSCILLLYKLILKDQSLALVVLQNFKWLKDYPTVDLISILSHIARLRVQFYSKLQHAGVISFLKARLESQDDSIYERSLNLIGNMCKHSTYFYNLIEQFVPKIIAGLAGSLKKRRQAVFVLGNIFFYNDRFSEYLLPKFQSVVTGLDSNDDMIIQNTIGLLINLYKYQRWTSSIAKLANKVVGLLSQKTDRNRIIIGFLLKVSNDKSVQGTFGQESMRAIVEHVKACNLAEPEKQISRLQRFAKTN